MAPRRLPKLSLMRIFAVVVIVPTAMVFTVLVTMIKSSHEYKVTEEVQLEVSHDGRALGVLTLGLFGEAVPLTVNNFVTLATSGYKGYSYKGSIFHRVIKKFMVQGGDVISGNGQGSVSIYGPSFMDERLDIKHAAPGFLSMANRGKDTNGCQFFVTTIATPWLDGHHVVFGKLVEGMSVLYHMESVATDYNNRPLQDLIITSSSRRLVKTPYYITDQPYNIKDWLKTISIPLLLAFSIVFIFHSLITKLDVHIFDDDGSMDDEAPWERKKREGEMEEKTKQEEEKMKAHEDGKEEDLGEKEGGKIDKDGDGTKEGKDDGVRKRGGKGW